MYVMRKWKQNTMLALGLTFLLSGCGTKEEVVVPEPEVIASVEGKVLSIQPELQVSDNETGQLLRVSTVQDTSSLQCGDVISFSYVVGRDPAVVESFTDIGQEEDVIQGVLTIMEPYIREYGWKKFSVDVSNASVLTTTEKKVLVTRVQQLFGDYTQVFGDTWEQLYHKGLILEAEDRVEFTDGLLLIISDTLETANGFTFLLHVYHGDFFNSTYTGEVTYHPDTRFHTVQLDTATQEVEEVETEPEATQEQEEPTT